MPEYNAGDAKLRIVPDARNFQRELEAKLKAMDVAFTVRLNIEMAQAKADMVRFRAEQDDKTINQRVNPQFTRAREELAAFRAEQRKLNVDLPVKVSGARAAGAAAGKQAAEGILSEVVKIGGEVGKVLGATLDLGKVFGIASLVASIPAAITAVASLAQAIGQLSGAALVVPGAVGGMVASFGTLLVGMDGMKAAYSALADASSGSVANAQAVTAAHESLSHAVYEEKQAQEGATQARKDARHSLEDLNLALRGGHISEEQAINDAKKARRDLATGRFKDALDYKDAQLRVEEADQRVAESRQSNIELNDKTTTANAKGIEGSDLVVAANERLVQSTEAVANAQQALTAAGGMGKVAEAFRNLSPAAAEVIHTLVDLKPQWIDLQKTVSGNMFEGVGASITNFVNRMLPNLKAGLGSIGTAWNSTIKTLLGSLSSDSSKGLLDRILGNTADAQTKFSKAIDPLVRGIGTLIAAGSDSLPRIADAIGKVAERFATFIEAADKDGRLKEWIDKGLTGFSDLGNILLNLGKSFFSITNALGGGTGLLGTLRTLTEKWASWLGSDVGQEKMKKFFTDGKQMMNDWKPIIDNLVHTLPAVFDAAKGAADIFMPVLRDVTGFLREHPDLVRKIFDGFVLWETLKFANVLTGLGKLENILGVGGKGGKGILGKLFLALEAFNLLDGFLNDAKDRSPNAGPDFGAQATGAVAGAYIGMKVGGVPGAVVGGVVGASAAPVMDYLNPPGPSTSGAAPGAVAGPTSTVGGLAIPGLSPGAGPGEQINAIDKTLPPGTPGSESSAANDAISAGLAANDPGAQWVNGVPVDGDTRVEHARRYLYWQTHKDAFQIPAPGSYAAGGPTPSGHGDGPTGGFLSELHSDEWVLPKHARKAIGDSALWALTKGRRFEGGGTVDEHGNPITRGPEPGPPAPVTPAPGAVPGADGAVGTDPATAVPSPAEMFGNQLMAGLADSLPFGLGNFLPRPGAGPLIGQAPDGRTTIGGKPIGLDPGILAGNPDSIAAAENYLGKWAGDTLSSAVTQLSGPLLSTFSLDNSILSPSNNYNQDIAQVAKFFGGGGGGDFGGGDIGMQTGTLPSGETIQVPTSGSSVTPNGLGGLSTGVGAQAPGGDLIGANPAAVAQLSAAFGDKGGSFNMTPELLASKGIQPLYNWGPGSTPEGNVPGWMRTLMGQFGLTANTRSTGETLHQGGYAWDIDGPQDKMDAFAQFVETNLAGQTLQLIHSNPTTGQKWGVAGGQVVGPGTGVPNYYSNDWGGHGNHVHWATNGPVSISLPGLGAMPGTAAPGGPSAVAAWGLVPQASYNGGTPATRAAVYQAFRAAGFGPDQWAPLVQLINHESSWSPSAQNSGSTAYGLFQFLDTTWAGVGAAKSGDPMAQAAAGLAYIKGRYGTPSAAWNFWQHPTTPPFDQNWYDDGGLLRPGMTMAMNATGQNERILNPEQTRNYEALQARLKVAALPTPTSPLPRIPDARTKQQGPPTGGNYDQIPPEALAPGSGPPPLQQQIPGDIYPTSPAPAPQETPKQLTPVGGGPEPQGGKPDPSASHLLPAVQTAITSGFATAGAIAQTAAAIGTFGAAGAAGGGLGGGGGPSIEGMFKQAGKIVSGIANVGASFLVGNVTGGTDPGGAYGTTLAPAQHEPKTAPIDNQRTYVFHGIDSRNVVDEMRLKDRQDQQAVLARW